MKAPQIEHEVTRAIRFLSGDPHEVSMFASESGAAMYALGYAHGVEAMLEEVSYLLTPEDSTNLQQQLRAAIEISVGYKSANKD